jgi:predicted metallopeptidase
LPLNFTDRMRELMRDIAVTCADLRHVDVSRVAVGFSQARHRALHGVFATTYPLRFPDRQRTTQRPHGTYEMPRVVLDGQEMLYVIEFRLPRFLDLPFDQKMVTVVHEMYHVSSACDGTLRRFAGGKPHHTGSRRRFDAAMAGIATAYLAATARPELHAFLRQDFNALRDAHGGICGSRVRGMRPRRIA